MIIEEGYDPVYGARPLKRTLQRRVLDPLALAVLQGEFKEGDAVTIDAEGGGLVMRRAQTVGGLIAPGRFPREVMTPTQTPNRPPTPRRSPFGRPFSPVWLMASFVALLLLANVFSAALNSGEPLEYSAFKDLRQAGPRQPRS